MSDTPKTYKVEQLSGDHRYYMILSTAEGFVHKEITHSEFYLYKQAEDMHFDERMKEGVERR
jgi:hypothetical protein